MLRQPFRESGLSTSHRAVHNNQFGHGKKTEKTYTVVKRILIPLSMTLRYIPAATRGHVHQDWLEGWYSFSFANWHDPERMQFGALRVLNDDIIASSNGFGFHPHRDMEIVTILLSGTLTHQDNTGGMGRLREGDVQVMTAGKGIVHSEYNRDPQQEVRSLQLWFFPREANLEPSYAQAHVPVEPGQQRVLVNGESSLQVAQDMRVVRMKVLPETAQQYEAMPGNGLYIFVIEGEGMVTGQSMGPRDALEVTEQESIKAEAGANMLDLLILDVHLY